MDKEKETESIFVKDRYIIIGLFIILPFILYFVFKNKYIQNNFFSIIRYFQKTSGNLITKFIYVIFVVLMNLIFMNSTLPNMLSGYIFGLSNGIILTLIGCILSGIISFYLSRKVFKNSVNKLFSEYPELNSIKNDEKNFNKKDWIELVTLSRLPPTYPYHIVSYFWGITGINIILYTIGSIIGILPGLSLETYIGYTLKNIRDIFKSDTKVGYTISIILITIIITFLIGYKAKKILIDKSKKNN